MTMQFAFVPCDDCAGRGFIEIRIPLWIGRHPWTGVPCASAGGGAARCSCAAGYRLVVTRGKRRRW